MTISNYYLILLSKKRKPSDKNVYRQNMSNCKYLFIFLSDFFSLLPYAVLNILGHNILRLHLSSLYALKNNI